MAFYALISKSRSKIYHYHGRPLTQTPHQASYALTESILHLCVLTMISLRPAFAAGPPVAIKSNSDALRTSNFCCNHVVRSRSASARVPMRANHVRCVPSMATTAPATDTTPRLTDAKELLDRTNTFIFDCDGVVWRGDSLIDRVPETIEYLRAAGKRVFFVTNNSTKSRAGYLKKFTGLGLKAEATEIFSSSFAAAAYLEQIEFAKTGKKVYIIGEVGICEELDLIGVPYVGGPADSEKQPNMGSGGTVDHDHDVGAVIVGFDRYINYFKIQNAQLCINENPGCMFIATNLDQVTHLTDAQEWAGNGSMVGAIKGCTGQEPTLVGKPSPLMIDYIVSKYNIERSEICMVGDRLDTDILFGKDNGLSSVLTLTGVTTEEKLHSPENSIKPDYYVSSIADMLPN